VVGGRILPSGCGPGSGCPARKRAVGNAAFGNAVRPHTREQSPPVDLDAERAEEAGAQEQRRHGLHPQGEARHGLGGGDAPDEEAKAEEVHHLRPNEQHVWVRHHQPQQEHPRYQNARRDCRPRGLTQFPPPGLRLLHRDRGLAVLGVVRSRPRHAPLCAPSRLQCAVATVRRAPLRPRRRHRRRAHRQPALGERSRHIDAGVRGNLTRGGRIPPLALVCAPLREPRRTGGANGHPRLKRRPRGHAARRMARHPPLRPSLGGVRAGRRHPRLLLVIPPRPGRCACGVPCGRRGRASRGGVRPTDAELLSSAEERCGRAAGLELVADGGRSQEGLGGLRQGLGDLVGAIRGDLWAHRYVVGMICEDDHHASAHLDSPACLGVDSASKTTTLRQCPWVLQGKVSAARWPCSSRESPSILDKQLQLNMKLGTYPRVPRNQRLIGAKVPPERGRFRLRCADGAVLMVSTGPPVRYPQRTKLLPITDSTLTLLFSRQNQR